jgi:hypothetical protein
VRQRHQAQTKPEREKKKEPKKDDEAVVIRLPLSKDCPKGGAFCTDCRQKPFPRLDRAGTASECRHDAFLAGIRYCARCALDGPICMGCGTSLKPLIKKPPQRKQEQKTRAEKVLEQK